MWRRGKWEILQGMNRVSRLESRDRLIAPRYGLDVFLRSYRELLKYKGEYEVGTGYELWDKDYWTLTRKVVGDLDIGKEWEHREGRDEKLEGLFKEKYQMDTDTIVIYTDASKQRAGKSVGVGVIVRSEGVGYEVSLNPKCSVFTGEIVGIEQALRLIADRDTDRDVLVLTDSRSSVEIIKSNRMAVHKLKEILQIREIANLEQSNKDGSDRKRKVVIGWIPNHTGIEGNELADIMTKEATEQEYDTTFKVPGSDLKVCFKDEILTSTQERNKREGNQKGRKYFTDFFKNNMKTPWFKKINAPRYFITIVNRLRSGHFNVKESLARKNYIEDPMWQRGKFATSAV